MKLNNKTILITGAGGGIGKEVVTQLLDKGSKIIAIDLKQEFLKILSDELKNDNLNTYNLDITDRKSVANTAKKISQKHKIDGIINCAGIIQPFAKVSELDYESIERVFNVNFYGTINTVKEFLPQLLKRPEATIVNVSSMGGFLPVPGQSVYGASKAAVKLLTEGMYAELKNTKVNVSVVFPGAVNTNITNNSGVKVPSIGTDTKKIKMLSAKDAAKDIIKGIEDNKLYIYIGQDSKFMNILYRLMPKYATDLIAKQMSSLINNKER